VYAYGGDKEERRQNKTTISLHKNDVHGSVSRCRWESAFQNWTIQSLL